MYHPALWSCVNKICDLRIHDPQFNKGHGDTFYNAFQRAIDRGDFRP